MSGPIDSFLSDLGVIQNEESEIVSKVLTSIANNETLTNQQEEQNGQQQVSVSNVAQSIIDNEVINIDDDQQFQEIEALKKQKGMTEQQRKKIKILDAATARALQPINQALPRSRISANILNGLVMEAAQSTKSQSSSLRQNSQQTIHCPVCNRSYEGMNELQINKHLDRCLRRQKYINEVPMTDYREDDDDEGRRGEREGREDDVYEDLFEQDDDDDDDVDYDHFNISRQLKFTSTSSGRKRKQQFDVTPSNAITTTTTSSSSAMLLDETASHGSLTSNSETNNNNNALQSAGVIDDWEEDDYLTRTNALSEEDIEVMETPFGTQTYKKSWNRLFDYQKEGCRWFFGLYEEGVGGILADEMGKNNKK
jgi:predicted transcriptional regulator